MSTFTKPTDDSAVEETAVVASDEHGDQDPTIARRAHTVRQRSLRPAAKPNDVPIGSLIGEYVVESELGAGGCGQVYGARDRDTGRRVAIKVLRSDMQHVPTAVPRFIREVQTLSRMAHESIVRVFDVGELAPGIPYYVMELLEGMNLRQLVSIHRCLSPREAVALLEPVVAALHCAHEQGIIHRDIKASNVFVSEQGDKRVVKLLDFGIAKLLYGEHNAAGLTAPGTIVGTPHAMAPEQIRCEALDRRADVYSLGVLTFLLLTGTYPFKHDDARMLTLMHLQTPPPRPSEVAPVPPALDEVVLRCLAKSPDDRYATAPEFLEALRRAAGDGPAPAEDQPKSATAVGIRLEVGTLGEVELNDDMIEDISGVLDIVEAELATHDFEFPLRASNTLTAVRLIDGSERNRFSVEQAQALIESIKGALSERDAAHPDVSVSLSVREDAVECRESGDGVEFVGGPLLDTDTWTRS
jgi:serine/threonine-protein kinase